MQAVLRGYDCRGAGGLQRARRGQGWTKFRCCLWWRLRDAAAREEPAEEDAGVDREADAAGGVCGASAGLTCGRGLGKRPSRWRLVTWGTR